MLFNSGKMFRGILEEEDTSWGVIIVALIICALLVFGIDCLIVWAVMGLWNGCLVEAVPVLAKLKYWQAWGIYLLFGFLFRSTTTINKND